MQDYLLSSHHSDRYYVLDNYLPILSNQIEHIEADFTSDLMAHCSTEKRIFLMQQYATDLMTYFRQSLVLPANQMARSVPSYLKKVRRHLDEHYALTFAWDGHCDNLVQLCRECAERIEQLTIEPTSCTGTSVERRKSFACRIRCSFKYWSGG